MLNELLPGKFSIILSRYIENKRLIVQLERSQRTIELKTSYNKLLQAKETLESFFCEEFRHYEEVIKMETEHRILKENF
jgi:hypothetical protein